MTRNPLNLEEYSKEMPKIMGNLLRKRKKFSSEIEVLVRVRAIWEQNPNWTLKSARTLEIEKYPNERTLIGEDNSLFGAQNESHSKGKVPKGEEGVMVGKDFL